VAKGAVKSKKSENLKHSFGMQDLFERGIIQIEATTFIRGRSIPKCIFLVDESQNLSLHEMKTILTRVGEGTKIVLLGDYNQIDSTYLNKFTNGLTIATEKFKNEEVAGHVTLVKGERSKLATIASDIL
jgi:PhoH-like ATPase